jgi:3'-phosphoadenosine 5'-phosphosulfate (PAPS) 3'-phosphatase
VPDTSSQLEKYLDIASETALAAGTIILDNWGKIEKIEEKGRSGDLVTEIDRRAETEILKIISRHFPKHGILAEESGKLPGTDREYLWAMQSSRWHHQLCPWLSRISRLHRTTDRRDGSKWESSITPLARNYFGQPGV